MRHLTVCVLLVLLAAACDPAAPTEPRATGSAVDVPSPASPSSLERGGGTLRWAIARPAAISPAMAVDAAGLLVVDTLFDGLTRVAPDRTVEPAAAVRWSPSRGGRRWRFTLRRGATYHDGDTVVARDFVRGWSRVAERGRSGAHLADVVGYRAVRSGRAPTLTGVRAIDDRTLEVRLRRPTMHLPTLVAHPALAPQPAVDRRAGRLIGNGPYLMAEGRGSGQFIRVERHDGWRNGPATTSAARVREIVFRITNADAAYVGFQQGRIDVAPVPAGALGQATRTYGVADRDGASGVLRTPTPDLYFLGMRVDRPPWDDVNLRRALSRAIDRRRLAAEQGDVQLDPAVGIVPPAVRGAGGPFCDTCLHLPSLAAPAFARAGVSEVTLTIDTSGGHGRVAERIQDDLAAVGVRLRIERLPFEEFLAAVESGEATLYRFGWRAESAVAGTVLDALVRSGAPVERGDGANYGGFSDQRVDALLARAGATRPVAEREELWVRAEQRALNQQALIPLFTYRQRMVVSDRVRGLTVSPWGAAPERATLERSATEAP